MEEIRSDLVTMAVSAWIIYCCLVYPPKKQVEDLIKRGASEDDVVRWQRELRNPLGQWSPIATWIGRIVGPVMFILSLAALVLHLIVGHDVLNNHHG